MHPFFTATLQRPQAIGLAFLLVTFAGVALSLFLRDRHAPGTSRPSGRSGARPARGDRSAQSSDRLPPPPPGTVEIYVGNLSYDMTDAQLEAEFRKFGVVSSARVVVQRGRSKGFGFVQMPHRKEAEIAIKALHDAEIMGRRLRVNEARGTSKA